MKSRTVVLVSLIALFALALSACAGGAAGPELAATEAPAQEEPGAGYFDPYAGVQKDGVYGEGAVEPEVAPAEPPVDSNALPMPPADVITSGDDGSVLNPEAGRMIIKNADMRLQVEDTDVAIDRVTQTVGDMGGYIISSRTWVQSYDKYSLKYASITMGLPVGQFERALNRLREFSIEVLDETASGEDVTDQFVDLESQLANLEATRERIKTFLDDAKTVDEALRINQQLSEIERQIEQIKGQINYLQDRSAFSTITVNLEPKLPELISTPTPTPTPVTWKPGDTFDDATRTLTRAYQGIVEFLIWFFVVIVPIVLPPVLLIWLLLRLLRRKPPKPQG